MSDYLVKAVFKILGGGSMGYNRGKIATRAAEQRARELESTQAFTAGESQKDRDFQVRMAAINQNDVLSIGAQTIDKNGGTVVDTVGGGNAEMAISSAVSSAADTLTVGA